MDHTPVRLAQAEAAVSNALRARPDLGEAHLARAMLLYHGSFDYEGARAELAVARKALPNSADVLAVTSYLDRRQGRWQDAVRNQERAVLLDPLNPNFLGDLTVLYDVLRFYREEERVADAAIVAVPQQTAYFRMIKAQIYLEAGKPEACRRTLALLPPGYDPSGGTTFTRICVALYERHVPEAAQTLAATRAERLNDTNGTPLPRAWVEALIARAAGEPDQAHAAMLRARAAVEEGARGQPDDAATLSLLGRIDAALGRKDDAWREGRRAVELRPVSADAMTGPMMVSALALIYAWTGDTDLAVETLGPLSRMPGGPTYGELHFDPAWDVLRPHPRFGPLVAAMEPR